MLAKRGPNCSFSSCPFTILLLLEYSPWEEAFPMGRTKSAAHMAWFELPPSLWSFMPTVNGKLQRG